MKRSRIVVPILAPLAHAQDLSSLNSLIDVIRDRIFAPESSDSMRSAIIVASSTRNAEPRAERRFPLCTKGRIRRRCYVSDNRLLVYGTGRSNVCEAEEHEFVQRGSDGQAERPSVKSEANERCGILLSTRHSSR